MNVCSTGTIVEFVVAVDMKNLTLALKTQVSDSLHDTYSTKYSYIWLLLSIDVSFIRYPFLN